MRNSILVGIAFLLMAGTSLLLSSPLLVQAQVINEFQVLEESQITTAEEGTPNLQSFVGGSAADANGNFSPGFLQTTMATIGQELLLGKPTYNTQTAQYERKGSVAQTLQEGIALTYSHPPASTRTYVADLLNSSGILVQPAYAQGLGFASLTPILDTWKIFRNIAYLFYTLVFLVIGFMIILRRKVGQAAVTAQQAIPQLIISLVAVTFSYAIAGLMIDLMYLFMFLMAAMFGAVDFLDKSIFGVGLELVQDGGGAAQEAINALVQDLVGVPIAGWALGWISGITAAVIVAVAIVFSLFKLFFTLVKTYITILGHVVLAPLWLMMGAFPGRNTFMQWLRSLVGNLVAFPTVLLMLIIFRQLTSSALFDGGFSPPFLSSGVNNANAFVMIIGLGLIMALPEAVEKAKQAAGASAGPVGELVNKGIKRGIDTGATTGRLAGIGIGGSIGAGLGAGKRFVGSRGSFNETMEGASDGFKGGATRGVRFSNFATRSVGANPPDVLNWANRRIDKRFDPEEAKRQQVFQGWEDFAQRLGKGGLGLPDQQSKEK